MNDSVTTEASPATEVATLRRHLPLAIRILGMIVAVWFVLLAGSYLVLRSFVKPSFEKLENRLVLDDLSRIHGAFLQVLDSLEKVAEDYATWDEMHTFAEHPSAEFIAVNLADSIFMTVKFVLLIVYDVKQRSVYSKAAEPVTGTLH
jgi:sensor domain CHASE-containing protein